MKLSRFIDRSALVRRLSNMEIYEASHPDNLDESMEPGYYFRHITESGKRWWEFWKPRFVRTGAIWETDDENAFELYLP